jgi:hypothetical protein
MLKSRTTMNDATSTRASAGEESPRLASDVAALEIVAEAVPAEVEPSMAPRVADLVW